MVNKFKTKSLKMADFDMLQNLVASSVKEVKEEFFGPVNTAELVTYLEDILQGRIQDFIIVSQ